MDEHGQADFGIHYKNNEEKALRGLLGFCQGLVADNQINSMEASHLDSWLRENEFWLKNNGDYVDILDVTTEILTGKKVSLEGLLTLKEELYTVLEYGDVDVFSCADEAITRLIGIAKGVTSDQVLNDKEILYLDNWLKLCGEWRDKWPISVISNQVEDVLSDGVITEDERDRLYSVLLDLIGGHITEHGAAGGMSSRLDNDNLESIYIKNKLFCFTGKFIFGTRKECENAIINKGGKVHSSITKKVDYLVIGALSSRDWANDTFGRKREKVEELKEKGSDIKVIMEEEWVKVLK